MKRLGRRACTSTPPPGGGDSRFGRGSCFSFWLCGFASPPDAPASGRTAYSREMKHGMAQKPIRFGLIAAAMGFEPLDDVGIQAHGDGLLHRPVKLADFGSAPIQDRRNI